MEEARYDATRPRCGKGAQRPIDEDLERAIARVIEVMRQNLSEPITLDDMARAAMFSKFHFTRVFQRVTGVSPGRFLSAMRLQEAKRLLLSTSMSVAYITYQVGYNSVGTFSVRFKESVGLSPSAYRRLGEYAEVSPLDDDHIGPQSATLKGDVQPPPNRAVGFVFIGLFRGCIPQGMPVRCSVLESPGPYELTDVPPGTWHLLAQGIAPGQERVPGFDTDWRSLVVGSDGPFVIQPETDLKRVDLHLRPSCVLDPPVLLDVRTLALSMRAS